MNGFVAEVDFDPNIVVFKMLDEDRDGFLNIVDLLRIYVNIPNTCIFAGELRTIFKYYLDHSIKPPLDFQR